MVLFYFVFPFREETEENNEMSGLSNSLASLILNRLALSPIKFEMLMNS